MDGQTGHNSVVRQGGVLENPGTAYLIRIKYAVPGLFFGSGPGVPGLPGPGREILLTPGGGIPYNSNPKHTPGQPGDSYNAGTESKNSIDLFGNSIQNGNKRYAQDEHGNVHQFHNDGNGTWHWAGSTGDKSAPLKKSDLPSAVKKEFNLPSKGSKK